jgi:hypothetical protein
MDNQFDFILSKAQRDTYLLWWKARHANKQHFSTLDYLIHSFLNSAVVDITKKSKQGFAQNGAEGGAYHPIAYKKALLALMHNLTYYTPVRLNTELSTEQQTRMATIASSILSTAH